MMHFQRNSETDQKARDPARFNFSDPDQRGDPAGESNQVPPFATLFNKLPPHRFPEKSLSSDGGDRPQTVTSGSSCSAAGSSVDLPATPPSAAQVVSVRLPERLQPPQTRSAGPLLNPDTLLTCSSSSGEERPVISFTIPPTEEDVKQMSIQDENGHVKRPLNAFFVWSWIHRQALRKACPAEGMIQHSILLGREWSKLSDKQKRPYYDVARKLKDMHHQQFPDYEFHPKKKAGGEHFSSKQGARESPCVSQVIPPVQSMLLVSNKYICPTILSYRMGFNAYPFCCSYNYLMVPSNLSRSSLENRNDQRACLEKTAQTTPETLQQPDILTSDKMECDYEDEIDVVTFGGDQHE